MQNAQDFFATTMNVGLQSFNENKPLTNSSNFTVFCTKYIGGSEIGCKRCNNCHLKWEKAAEKKGEPIIYTCHAGLTSFAIPIKIEGKHIANVLGGQVLIGPPDEKHFRQIAKELGINEDAYLAEVNNLRILSMEKVKAITDLLSIVINSIAAIAYANLQLAELGLDYKIPRNIVMEEWFFLNCEKIRKPISAREFEVLKLIVMGKNNVEIAKELFISVHTAKAHVSSILEKFSVDDRVQIAVKAVREGLI